MTPENNKKKYPFMLFPPGLTILDEMKKRNWGIRTLSWKSGTDWMILYKIIYMCEPVTIGIAQALGKTFNLPVEFWLDLESNFREWVKWKEKHGDMEDTENIT